MNELKLVSEGIFSSESEISNLAKKDEAKILLISDSHGNVQILRFVIENFGKNCDALMFSGDGILDLMKILEEADKNESLKECLPSTICFVKGNNDPLQYIANFNPFEKVHKVFRKSEFYSIKIPDEIMLSVAKKKIIMVHGHEHGVYYSDLVLEKKAKQTESDIVVFGHTHVPCECNYKKYLVNPGSISLPRNNSKPGFAFLFIQKNNVVYSTFFHQENISKLEFTPFVPEPIF